MKIINRCLTSALTVACLSTAANTSDMVAQFPAAEDWFEYTITWHGGSTSYKARWHVIAKDGAIVVCGVGAHIDNSMRSNSHGVLHDLGFFIDETLYLTDMKFFAKANRPKDLVGATSNCVSTGKPPPKEVKDGVSLRPTKKVKDDRLTPVASFGGM